MNIFALSRCPVESAQQMLDKHVVKMPTETCQMLHTNQLYFIYKGIYGVEPSLKDLKVFHTESNSHLMKPAMLNHPSTIWARQSAKNFSWLFEHGIALCDEYTHRYGKKHGAKERILMTHFQNETKPNWPHSGLTPVTIAMLDKYRLDEKQYSQRNPNWTGWDFVIDSYRHYYLEGKWRFAEWRMDRRPDWFPTNQYEIKYNEWASAFNKNHGANIKLMEV
jgi:hypothetical protein